MKIGLLDNIYVKITMSYLDNDHMTVNIWKHDNNNIMKNKTIWQYEYDDNVITIRKWQIDFGKVTSLQWQYVNNSI